MYGLFVLDPAYESDEEGNHQQPSFIVPASEKLDELSYPIPSGPTENLGFPGEFPQRVARKKWKEL